MGGPAPRGGGSPAPWGACVGPAPSELAPGCIGPAALEPCSRQAAAPCSMGAAGSALLDAGGGTLLYGGGGVGHGLLD
jgi:hypothetical protein